MELNYKRIYEDFKKSVEGLYNELNSLDFDIEPVHSAQLTAYKNILNWLEELVPEENKSDVDYKNVYDVYLNRLHEASDTKNKHLYFIEDIGIPYTEEEKIYVIQAQENVYLRALNELLGAMGNALGTTL